MPHAHTPVLVAALTLTWACSGIAASPEPQEAQEEQAGNEAQPAPVEADEGASSEPEAPRAPAGAPHNQDDPDGPANRVARWRATLPPECLPHFRDLTHPSGRYAFGWVYEGSMPDDEAACQSHRSAGIIATVHGTATFHGGCMYEPGVEGNLDGDEYPDLLIAAERCAEGYCPGWAALFRDTESGPMRVSLRGADDTVGGARWYERDEGTQGVQLDPLNDECRSFITGTSAAPVRWVWQDDHVVRDDRP